MADGSTAARGQYRDHMQHCEDRPVDEKCVFIARVRVPSRSFSGLNPMAWKTARIFVCSLLPMLSHFSIIFLQARAANLSRLRSITRSAKPAMSLKKQYLKKNSACKVTFSFPKEAAGSATHVSLVGDFNAWNKDAIPMKRLKNGAFTATVTLEANKEYHFRYFLDGQRWENDWNADKYVANTHGSDDSVVVV